MPVTEESKSTPEAVVHRQIDAYNDGDVDAFSRCFAEQATVASLEDGEVAATGRDEIREQYGDLFEAVPELRCTVTDEFTVGAFVVGRERVTGIDEPFDALAVYLVQDGVIQRLWLGGEP